MSMISNDDDSGFDPELVRSLIEQMNEISPMDTDIPPISLDFEGDPVVYDVPDSEPIAGFSLLVSDPDNTICHWAEPIDDRYTLKVLRLTAEAQEWCDENLKDKYWFFSNSNKYRSFYFTTERDYIIFKLRFG